MEDVQEEDVQLKEAVVQPIGDSCSENDVLTDKFEGEFVEIDSERPKVVVGSRFPSVDNFRYALKQHCVTNEFVVKYIKNERTRVTAKCKVKKCNWRIHAYVLQDEITFESTEARGKAIELIHGKPAESYKLIPELREEILKANPDSVVEYELDRDEIGGRGRGRGRSTRFIHREEGQASGVGSITQSVSVGVQGSNMRGTQESMRGTQNMWIGMDVEASGGANQGHANIGALRAQSDMGDSNIHIQSITAQTKMRDVSVNVGEITTNATSHQVGEVRAIVKVCKERLTERLSKVIKEG
ncbi:hypothetical protein QJS10_CPA03g01068 [Acorus calamus]|uniref:Transposase MuDR plant domain-containing protein n=1 Tax=Acorus calamus TaxID=4465 RepID=A0AAV9F8J7_ACOCL|nr:hypothetical protein QJS10_CPA03g01068 [Acorus calamus]